MVDPSNSGERIYKKKPGRKPQELYRYMKKCNDSIYETDQKIQFWEEFAKKHDARENKEEIKRINYKRDGKRGAILRIMLTSLRNKKAAQITRKNKRMRSESIKRKLHILADVLSNLDHARFEELFHSTAANSGDALRNFIR